MKWTICCNCGGDGSHAKHLGVINTDEWSDDELSAYMNGAYDTECQECKGTGKVRVGEVHQVTEDGWTDKWLYCSCGSKHYLGDDDSSCDTCGQLYNAFGQALNHPSQWSEDGSY